VYLQRTNRTSFVVSAQPGGERELDLTLDRAR